MYGAAPQSTDKHSTGRPSSNISQCCAYGNGGEVSPSCHWLEISERSSLESAATVLNVVSVGFSAIGSVFYRPVVLSEVLLF